MAVVLDARGINKRFGAVTAAHDINAAIEQDSVVGLIGTNGAGKTTFINMITGYISPIAAAYIFKGAILPRSRRARSRASASAARFRSRNCMPRSAYSRT